jgi:hypothetical protein
LENCGLLFIWLRIGKKWRAIVNMIINFRLQKIRGIS